MNDKRKYEGVHFHRRSGMFKATFTMNGQRYDCGYSTIPREAARLRDLTIIRVGGPLKKLQILTPKEN